MNAYIERETFSPSEAMRIASERAARLEAEGDLVLARAMRACARAAEATMTRAEEAAEKARLARARARLDMTRTGVVVTPYNWAGAYPPL